VFDLILHYLLTNNTGAVHKIDYIKIRVSSLFAVASICYRVIRRRPRSLAAPRRRSLTVQRRLAEASARSRANTRIQKRKHPKSRSRLPFASLFSQIEDFFFVHTKIYHGFFGTSLKRKCTQAVGYSRVTVTYLEYLLRLFFLVTSSNGFDEV